MNYQLKKTLRLLLPLLPALVVYAFLANKLSFIQDDAYISYRYVANFLGGHGLVYNIGERIEGFTNFAWVIYSIFWGSLGVGYIIVSRLTGLLCGGGLIVLTWLVMRQVIGEKNRWVSYLPAYLVGFNLSLAYWSPAGLETAAFGLAVLSALYLYLRRHYLLIFVLAMAVWIRPEGALLAGLLLIIEAATERRWPVFSLRCVLAALVISLPFAVFKVVYYGSIFPNPFFAKTGLHLDQLTNGLEYVGQFFAEYGFIGLGLIVPLLFWDRISRAARAVLLFAILYTVYIVLVGGDVLKVHRFFVPLFGPAAILAALSVHLLTRKLQRKTRSMVLFMVSLPLLGLTCWLPYDHVNSYNFLERKFTHKMKWMAEHIAASDTTDFSVAVSTIGIFGYELLGHEIIDMVGLTDSTIARNSEEPIKGMQTTWKEQKHNTRSLLTRSPDYIMFSTGIKPSAPAERALLLFKQFQDAYRTVGWFYKSDPNAARGTIASVFKRAREITGVIEPTYPVEFVQHYKTGLDYYVAGDQVKAIEYYNRALRASPQPYYVYVLYQKAFSHIVLERHETAVNLLEQVLQQDSLVFEAHKDLYLYASLMNDTARAAIHERWIKKLVPWYLSKLKSDSQRAVRDYRRRSQQRGAPAGG